MTTAPTHFFTVSPLHFFTASAPYSLLFCVPNHIRDKLSPTPLNPMEISVFFVCVRAATKTGSGSCIGPTADEPATSRRAPGQRSLSNRRAAEADNSPLRQGGSLHAK